MAEGRSTMPPQPSQNRESFPSSNPNIFSDDFALEPLELTDSHQPAQISRENGHDVTADTPRQSLSFQQPFDSPAGSLRRSRGSRRSDGYSSISSRFDNRLSQSTDPPRSVTPASDSGHTLSTQHHSIRTISTFGFPRAQSPYQGATGPSQPYGMYSQDIGLNRTPSAATTSTIRRPERSYSGPNGPTQPYGLYAQNTVPEDDAELAGGLVPPAVAGMPGSNQQYQRRLGPDGEDADDLIGPDGYTEQLPPYSRYANGVPPKYTSGIGSIAEAHTSTMALDDSQETLQSPQSRDTGLVNPFSDSSTQLSSTASAPVPPKDEGGNFKERIRRRGKKKVCCGVSCWLCIVMVVVVFLAVLLGGVVGGVVAHKHGEEKGMHEALAAQTVTAAAAAPTTTVTQPPDAVSLSSTPSNLPPLQFGTFAVSLNEPIINSNSCLTNVAQACAWDCTTGSELSMTVSSAGPHGPVVSLTYPESPVVRYGAQPPQLSGQANLFLMTDKSDSSRGPAYFFAQQYNKTVIVHDADLHGPSNSKRSLINRWFSGLDVESTVELSKRDDYYSQWTSNTTAKPGDRPWYCQWPGTILEGFIFVTQEAKQTSTGSAAYSAGSGSTAALSAPSQNARKRQTSADPPYPNLVKIEERRNPFNTVQPFCQQMQILYNGKVGLATDQTGQLVKFQLEESEPSFVQHQLNPQTSFDQGAPSAQPMTPTLPTGLPGRRRALDTRDVQGSGSSCQCEWMSGR